MAFGAPLGERGILERVALQDREPDLDLVELGSLRRGKVETYVLVALEPTIILGLMGVEIVEDDMGNRVWVSRDDLVHEVKELDTPPANAVTLPVATSK